LVVKRFVAANMQEAMKMIRDEIGPDAVILDSNPVRSKGIGGLFKQGVEVVAAYDPSAARTNADTPASSQPAGPAPAVRPAPQPSQRVAARYAAAAAWPEPAARTETDRSEDADKREDTDIPTGKLEPVIFPVLNLRDAAKLAAESASPISTAVIEPENVPLREAPVKAEPASAPKAEAVWTPAAERLQSRAEEKPASEPRPAFVEYQTVPEPLRDEIASLKNTVQAVANRMGLMTSDPALTLPPDIMSLYNSLVERDVPEDMAHRVALMAQAVQSRRTIKAETAARQIVMDRLGEPVPIRIRPNRQNVMFFVGPTGAGKTTTLAKLAGMLALEHKLRVGFVNMDTYRIGAMEHLRIYADIMNIPVHTAYSSADLADALVQMADRDVVLVDTAGKAAGDDSYRQEITEWINVARADEVFLVVSVATGHRAVKEIIRHYSFLPDYKLIMTKLDEVSAWGNVLHIRELAGKPLAYVTTGQNVPDDIRPADTRRLADNIVGRKVCVL
jgi:flagellar biosynthesis protein FlhF